MNRPRGFTLIELLVVLAILSLLMSIVGPLTIQQVDKMKAKEELQTLSRWLDARQYQMFARGYEGLVTFDSRKVLLQRAIKDNDLLKLKNEAYLELDLISFPKQQIKISPFGFTEYTEIDYVLLGKRNILTVGEKYHAPK
ncbi:type II secretion system protein [Catenovulum sp. SM1970]|uniref:type II secretion system protein n=1 Tax=Marinifaba aquimaris TaxID=2741323 RepID=UPI0015747AE3|nr:type II secretion system protein [Marinifaba aquimaris]NTS76917.1 type II secretion system protein [Marinifaba aquimaris]